MPKVDFKLSRITQWGTSTHALVRVYSGDVTTEIEYTGSGVRGPVTRYRRQTVVQELFLDFPGVKTEQEIIQLLRGRLRAVAAGRVNTEPIDEQRDA